MRNFLNMFPRDMVKIDYIAWRLFRWSGFDFGYCLVLKGCMGKYKIWLYIDNDGSSPVKDIIDKSNKIQRSKISKHFLFLTEFGITLQNPYLTKIKNTPLWESRILGKDNIRIFCAESNNGIAILHVFIKKRQKTHSSDISLALKRFKIIT